MQASAVLRDDRTCQLSGGRRFGREGSAAIKWNEMICKCDIVTASMPDYATPIDIVMSCIRRDGQPESTENVLLIRVPLPRTRQNRQVNGHNRVCPERYSPELVLSDHIHPLIHQLRKFSLLSK
jgi:hypothetical protein